MIATGVFQAAQLASFLRPTMRFATAMRRPARAQQEQLLRVLRAARGSRYARDHRFESVHSIADYQSRAPTVDYEGLRPWVDEVAQGTPKVLTGAPVKMLERSGGSTHAHKLIPYTDNLLRDFRAALAPWLVDMHRRHPKLLGTRSYWSVSQATKSQSRTAGGVPLGFDDDAAYLGRGGGWLMRRLLAVPKDVSRSPTPEAWRTATLLHLLNCADLGFISVWSPTFLLVLMQALEQAIHTLVPQLPTPRRRVVEDTVQRYGLRGDRLWPRLALISCWRDGPSTQFLDALQAYFPGIPIEGKGLLATEGVVSIPQGGACIPALCSHFLEFIDLQRPQATPRLAHELQPGGTYSPLLSTTGGLYRYHLKDVLRCTSAARDIPQLKFEGKLEQVADLCGEKLHAEWVHGALRRIGEQQRINWRFAMLAPAPHGKAGYVLYLESSLSRQGQQNFTQALEHELCTQYTYRYCRDLKQLEPLRCIAVQNGWQRYEASCLARGQTLGDIKPITLATDDRWHAPLTVADAPCT